jgi:hypothetical protein
MVVSANSPAPADNIHVVIYEKPDNCVYVDLLIKINPSDKNYVVFNSEYGEKLDLGEKSAIAQYNVDGFMSYTFHFLGAMSENTLVKEEGSPDSYYSEFAGYRDPDGSLEFNAFDRLQADYPILKLALIDSMGTIIKVSDKVSIATRRGYLSGPIYYHIAANSVEVNIIPGFLDNILYLLKFLIMILFAGIFRFAFSTVIETLIAIPFKLKPYRKIVIVNLITQTILTIAMALSGYSYLVTLIAIEAFVYVAEFISYSILYKQFSKIRILFYTVVANTVSLGLGLLLNYLGVFKG